MAGSESRRVGQAPKAINKSVERILAKIEFRERSLGGGKIKLEDRTTTAESHHVQSAEIGHVCLRASHISDSLFSETELPGV